MDGAAKRATVVKCERHGLHYDAATMTGCVLCRRETGGAPTPGPQAATSATSSSGPSLGAALGTTALLLALATLGLTALHRTLAETLSAFGGDAAFASPDPTQQMDEEIRRQLKDLGLGGGPDDLESAGDVEDEE